MNVGVVIALSLVILWVGFRYYGSYVARALGVDENRPTPAVSQNDGKDFVPTRTPVLFGHHFASIAAAGPIVVPTLAVIYGFVPAWIWILGGVIFIGAVHDFSSLFVSMREKGKSVAEVARSTLGRNGFIFYIAFALILCILVCAAFLQLAAVALTSTVALGDLGLPADQTLLRTTIGEDGVPRGSLGGIASTSVILMTLTAPLVGWLLYRRRASIPLMSGLALLIAAVSVWVGFQFPLTVPSNQWMMILSVYTLFAASIPVYRPSAP